MIMVITNHDNGDVNYSNGNKNKKKKNNKNVNNDHDTNRLVVIVVYFRSKENCGRKPTNIICWLLREASHCPRNISKISQWRDEVNINSNYVVRGKKYSFFRTSRPLLVDVTLLPLSLRTKK